MAVQDVLGDVVSVACEPEETDGLLAYLQTLCRVAHAPGESHWCTPGHNRGQALDRSAPDFAVIGRRRLVARGAGNAGAPRVVALRGVVRPGWGMPHLALDRAEA